ncbi:MAG TPA: FAD-dependent oxidoreductase [Gemmatimonadales bacterium]|nr:FAD-dependent oxidoreductase [Gemmatimonadales bacterium]
MPTTVAVIGGGISGLASAVRIAGLGHRVTLFEASETLGGLGATFPVADTHLERFYHCILPSDRALLAHIEELGLSNQLVWRRSRMGFTYRGRAYSLNTAADLLRFTPLTLVERLRLGLMGIRTRFAGCDERLDLVTAESWLRSMTGDRAFDVLWKPLLSAKIGDQYPALPALWLSSRMHREKNAGPERKGFLTGGYRSLIAAFEHRIMSRGGRVRLGTRVDRVEQVDGGMDVVLTAGDREGYDYVVVTSPLSAFQALTRTLSIPESIRTLELDYQGVLSAVFLTDRPLTEFYWMPFVESGTTAQGIIAMSNLVPLERVHGLHVNYLVNYTHRDSPLFQRDEADLLAAYRADIAKMFPNAADSIRDQYLFRAPFVEPIWTLNYRRLKPPASIIPGRLYLACTAQHYPQVNSWNSCCDVVDSMMARVVAETAALPSRGEPALA